MASVRQEKFASLLQKDLGELFQQLGRDVFKGSMITVSGVHISPDLGYAKVYLSLFNTSESKVDIDAIRLHTKDIRHQLALKIKKQVRVIPELEFFLDDTLSHVIHMEKLFEKLNSEKKKEDE
jgi:ribosome-binding factor A